MAAITGTVHTMEKHSPVFFTFALGRSAATSALFCDSFMLARFPPKSTWGQNWPKQISSTAPPLRTPRAPDPAEQWRSAAASLALPELRGETRQASPTDQLRR